jgi:hypothetical protein
MESTQVPLIAIMQSPTWRSPLCIATLPGFIFALKVRNSDQVENLIFENYLLNIKKIYNY